MLLPNLGLVFKIPVEVLITNLPILAYIADKAREGGGGDVDIFKKKTATHRGPWKNFLDTHLL